MDDNQLVFVDESRMNVAMTPIRARAPRSDRRGRVPVGRLGHILADRGSAQLGCRLAHDAGWGDEHGSRAGIGARWADSLLPGSPSGTTLESRSTRRWRSHPQPPGGQLLGMVSPRRLWPWVILSLKAAVASPLLVPVPYSALT